MRSPHSRAIALTVAVALITIALPVASASAITASTQITTPSGISYPFVQENGKIAIAGTATGLAVPDLEIRCYYGTEQNEYRAIAREVPVVSGAFSAEGTATELPDAVCQLRAVPETKPAEKLALPPGDVEPYEGPIVVASEFFSEFFPEASPATSNYYAASSTLTGTFFLGGYALESYLYSPSGHDNAQLFYGAENLAASAAGETRSSVQVDGANAYLPKAAREVEQDLREEAASKKQSFTPPSGELSVEVHDHFNESTHQMTVEEEDPAVKCSPGAAVYPPTLSSCTSFLATGVKVKRTWQTSTEDHVASLTELWTSTDGAAHAVNVRYLDELASAKGGGAYEFPGEAAFGATKEGEARTFPAGPGTILYKTASSLSELGNGEDPQGAIVYDTPPSEAIAITNGSRGGTYSSFEAPYQRTVPAGGSSAPVRMTFIQAFALTEVDSLAAAAIAGYRPSVSISAPANGTTVTSPSITVTGTASDSGALSSLTVNGAGVAVGTGGTWSTAATLKAGANTITATVTDAAGLTASSSITVTYAPPKPAPTTASQTGSASGAKGRVTFTLACHGPAGTSCKVHVTLTAVERSRRGHLIAVVAAKTHSKKVTLAATTVTIPAGGRLEISLKLNATARKLLARFGKLPAHLVAILEGEGAHQTVIAENLTVRPKPRKHKH
jgi:hypothetical protein